MVYCVKQWNHSQRVPWCKLAAPIARATDFGPAVCSQTYYTSVSHARPSPRNPCNNNNNNNPRTIFIVLSSWPLKVIARVHSVHLMNAAQRTSGCRPSDQATWLVPNYMDHYSFTDPWGMDGWVGHVGWPIADGLTTQWSPIQLAVWRRIGKVRRPRPAF